MQAKIAIVIAGFNRPDSLKRLLSSISNADYRDYKDISLVISIDHSGNDECKEIADSLHWEQGEKTVLLHSQKLGLKDHIMSCADLVEDFDAIIVLEDDLYVAPGFYDYAQQAFAFYKNDVKIAGIGLYNYKYNEIAHCPFEPITDEYDNYFLQVPCSWGQMWTKGQWQSFKEYLKKDSSLGEECIHIPPAVSNWPVQTSWKRLFFCYIIAQRKYFVYPRVALSTNFGDPGTHFEREEYVWQSPLLVGTKKFRFSTIKSSRCIYDAYFELDGEAYQKLINSQLSVTFDLNGSRPLQSVSTEYLISSKQCSDPVETYQPSLYPYEQNIIAGIRRKSGGLLFFSLGKTSSFTDEIPVNRLEIDVKRTLPHTYYLLEIAKDQVRKTVEYRLGQTLYSLLLLPRRIFTKFKTIFLSS